MPTLTTTPADAPTLLTPTEAAQMLAVNPKTLARWSGANKIHAVRTLGGHRRYRLEDVNAILHADPS